ncbi:hypothetical protein SeMB42_g02303 [Synchytrium endobioticum]|uniref:Uncharacterized protein n=1 Tax=Synchytrium endobioticum TaxID=286115 RepID=A0A507DFH6_9FUNG|nr:hypothetical protein SeMB42_g02303 [Synchytrium endobioticum]
MIVYESAQIKTFVLARRHTVYSGHPHVTSPPTSIEHDELLSGEEQLEYKNQIRNFGIMKPIMMKKVITIVVLQATMLYYLVSAGGCLSGGHGQDTADFATRVTTPAQGVADKARRLKEAQGLAELPARTATLGQDRSVAVPLLAALARNLVDRANRLIEVSQQVMASARDVENILDSCRGVSRARELAAEAQKLIEQIPSWNVDAQRVIEQANEAVAAAARVQDLAALDAQHARILAAPQTDLGPFAVVAAQNLADLQAQHENDVLTLHNFRRASRALTENLAALDARQTKAIDSLHGHVRNFAAPQADLVRNFAAPQADLAQNLAAIEVRHVQNLAALDAQHAENLAALENYHARRLAGS